MVSGIYLEPKKAAFRPGDEEAQQVWRLAEAGAETSDKQRVERNLSTNNTRDICQVIQNITHH